MPLYYLPNARSEVQRAKMAELEAAGICCLCPDGIAPVHTVGIWSVVVNAFPYEGARRHLLIVPKFHLTSVDGLSESSWLSLHAAIAWVVESFRLSSYTVKVRCGDVRETGGTIEHLHVHVTA